MGGPPMTTPIRRADVLRVINNVPIGDAAPRAADLGGGSKSGYRETDHVKKYYELSRF